MTQTLASSSVEAAAPVRSLRRLRIVILLLTAALLTAHSAQEWRDARVDRETIIAGAVHDGETLLTSLDEHLRRTIHAAAPVLALAGSQVEASLGDDFNPVVLYESLNRLKHGAPQFGTLAFAAADGRVSVTSETPFPQPIDLGIRDYFPIHRNDVSAELRIGEPVIGRITGRMIVPLTRRVNDLRGNFAGVIIGTLEAAYFEKFYSRLQSGASTLAIFSENATLLARIPADRVALGTSFATMPAFATHLPQASHGWFAHVRDDYGPDRHVIYRRVEGLPFVLVMTIPDDALLEPWSEKLLARSFEVVWVSLSLVFFAGVIVWATYRQEKLAAGLVTSEARYRDLVDVSSDWHWEMGPDLRFTWISDQRRPGSVAYDSIVGKTREETADPGTPDLAPHLDDLAKRRPFRDFVYRRVLANGDIRYTKTSGKPLFGPNGAFLGYRGTAADVTAAMRAEENAVASRKLLDEAIETLHEGFVLFDAQDRFVLCNQKFRELYAETADLLVPGAYYETILRESAQRGQFPEAAGRVGKWLKNALSYHHIRSSTRQRLLPGQRWVEVREVKLADGGCVGIHIDITESRAAQDKLRTSEERLRTIAANLTTVILEFSVGPDGSMRQTFISDRARDMLGYSAAEIIEDPMILARIIEPEFLADYCRTLAEAERSMTPVEIEYRFRRRDGALRWAHSLLQPRPGPGGETFWDGTIRDVTEAKAAEEQRRELENQLRHLQRVEAVGTLAGGMAHEINNKLVPIVTFSELLLMKTPEGSADRKPLQTIHDAAGRIRDLVSRILTMSRSETPGTASISLRALADSTVTLLRATLRPNVRLVCVAEGEGRILGDESQIEQVLVNLCTNAAHAIGTKQGEIRIAIDEIVVVDGAATAGGAASGQYVRLRVSDTGAGMNPTVVQRIFEPFFTTKGIGEGTGLGLSIVHGIVNSHRGRISVESEVGRGTSFTVLFPLAAANDVAGSAALSAAM